MEGSWSRLIGRAEQRLGAQARVAASTRGLCCCRLLSARDVSVLGSGSPSGKWDGRALLGEQFWPTTSTQYTHWKAPPSNFPSFLLSFLSSCLYHPPDTWSSEEEAYGKLKTLLMHPLLVHSLFTPSSQFPRMHTLASSYTPKQQQGFKTPSSNLSCVPIMCLTELFKKKAGYVITDSVGKGLEGRRW